MSEVDNIDNYEYWRKYLEISVEEFNLIKKDIINISLKTGDILYDFDESPKGIILINQGSLRLVGKDENNNLISIEKFTKNEIASAKTILLGLKDTSLIAINNVKGFFFTKELFIKLIKSKINFLNLFKKISKEEYFYLALFSKNPRLPESNELLIWAESQSEKKEEVILIKPGKNKVPNIKKEYLISSNNIKDFNFGDTLKANNLIEINGELPARLIPFHENWLPVNNEKFLTKSNKPFESKINKKEDLKTQDNNTEKVKSLEDLYGRLDSEKSFPFEKGKGLIEEPLACFRMISLFFNIPFRKDLIKKILQDQVNRSGNKELNLYNLAAISDLIGLKTSLIKSNSIKNFERIPSPSIFLIKNSPVVCWKTKNNYCYLSDPKSKK